MSIYRPKRGTMKAVRRVDGWWVDDAYGPFDGPYETERDAWSAISSEEE